MIKVDKKNKWAVDLAIHIPMPSFEIKITNTEKEEIENVELTYIHTDDASEINHTSDVEESKQSDHE